MNIEPTLNERGFKQYEPVASEYGGHVSVSESSSASGPHIWVRASAPADLNDPHGPQLEAPIHLTIENAMVLRDQLSHVIEHHYQSPVDDRSALHDPREPHTS